MHHLTSTIILPSSHPSSIQIFNPSTSTLLSELEVTPSNRVSGREEISLEPSRVEIVVLSSTGEWMATLDTRRGDDSFRGEAHLKIWQWNSKTKKWTLNTRIDRPHGSKRLTSMAFSPSTHDRHSLQLATIGTDCSVRTWRLRILPRKNASPEGRCFACRLWPLKC